MYSGKIFDKVAQVSTLALIISHIIYITCIPRANTSNFFLQMQLPKMFYKKGVLKNFAELPRKIYVRESLF